MWQSTFSPHILCITLQHLTLSLKFFISVYIQFTLCGRWWGEAYFPVLMILKAPGWLRSTTVEPSLDSDPWSCAMIPPSTTRSKAGQSSRNSWKTDRWSNQMHVPNQGFPNFKKCTVDLYRVIRGVYISQNFEIATIHGINFHEINRKPHPRT